MATIPKYVVRVEDIAVWVRLQFIKRELRNLRSELISDRSTVPFTGSSTSKRIEQSLSTF